jgi:hypothetical protein
MRNMARSGDPRPSRAAGEEIDMGLESAALALDGLSFVAGQSREEHGVEWSSSRVTYPADLTGVPAGTRAITNRGTICFANGLNEVRFALSGHFCCSDDPITEVGHRTLANVGFELEPSASSDLWLSSLTFHAEASPTPVFLTGGYESPVIEYHVHGTWDPFGFGEVTYSARLFVDHHSQVSVQNCDGEGGEWTYDQQFGGFTITVK